MIKSARFLKHYPSDGVPESFIQELPRIIDQGKKEAHEMLDRLSSNTQTGLQTNDDDKLQVMQTLLTGDPAMNLPSMRGMIDLICIDPPYDDQADSHTDTWKNDTVSFLEMLYPRLVLMRELLSEQGTIYVRIDQPVGSYVKVLLDDVFGKDNFRNELIEEYSHWANVSSVFLKMHEDILFYSKTSNPVFNEQSMSTDEKRTKNLVQLIDGEKVSMQDEYGNVMEFM